MDREGLYAELDKFLAALNVGDHTRLTWGSGAFHSENNVMLEIGDGVWGTIQRLGDYTLRLKIDEAGAIAEC